MDETQKYAAIYIRVSTDAQREEGYSIDAQKEMLQAYCISKGLKKYEWFIDGGYTGSNLDRPELKRMIVNIKQGLVSHVIIYKLDRLSRSQKDTLYLIEDVFNPYGVDFISTNESLDTSTPLGRLMIGILSAFAQLERENIRERTRMGMKERIKEGLWMGGGRIPFGYDYDKSKGILVPNHDADKVRKIYELYISGYSFGKIAEILGMKYDKLPYQIMTRKTNIGIINYNGVDYKGNHEPLVDEETYEKAMLCLKERSIKRTIETDYLLTGLLVCGKCGAKMRYQKWGRNGCKIYCYSQDKSKKHLIKDPNCNNIKHDSIDIENEILKNLFQMHFAEDAKPEDTQKDELKLLDVLNKQYEKINMRLKRLYTIYSDGDDTLLETINEVKKELNKTAKQIEIEILKMKNETQIFDVKKNIKNLSDAWEYMNKKERKRIINSCINKVTITDNNINIDYVFHL